MKKMLTITYNKSKDMSILYTKAVHSSDITHFFSSQIKIEVLIKYYPKFYKIVFFKFNNELQLFG